MAKLTDTPPPLQNVPTNWCSRIHNNFIKFHNRLVFTNSDQSLKTINYLIATQLTDMLSVPAG